MTEAPRDPLSGVSTRRDTILFFVLLLVAIAATGAAIWSEVQRAMDLYATS